jgi:hypothetical protein
MKCIIHVYQLNALYSQALADELNAGKESADNRKYLWEDEFEVKGSVLDVEEYNDVQFPLQGQLEDGSTFNYEIKNMRLVGVKTVENPDLFVGASLSIVHSLMIERKKDVTIKLFLKDDEPYANPIPGIYIASKEFPKELIR